MSIPSKKPKPNLIYALDANGNPVHIDSVPNGFSCHCRCPRCKSELQAKNGGNERAHHFAHKDGADCVGAVESAIHYLAKEILKESLCVQLPGDAGLLRLDSVETEKNYPDLKLRPDCVGHYGDKSLWIEFKRTHEVDAHKAGKIISARIDCIEIDLSECDQDKEQLREFITKKPENRKWIFSEQYGVGLFEISYDERSRTIKDSLEENNDQIERHFAFDENGKLIDFRVPSEFDAINHSYYCPNCGKEVVLARNKDGRYVFDHIDTDVPCDDQMYLRNSAVATIQRTFEESKNFVINLPQYRFCKQGNNCPCNQDCRVRTNQQYDLKSLGFLKCEKNYKYTDTPYRTDLVFYRENIQKDPIEVLVNTENYENEIETSHRLIKVTVYSENDIYRLEQGLKDFEKISFSGFTQYLNETAEPVEINNVVLKYTVYTSGKIYIGPVKCTALQACRKPNVLREGFFTKTTGDLEDMRIFLLLHYKALQKELCQCPLCWSLKKSMGHSNAYICTRYKKVGTPKAPLQEKYPPKRCPYFRLDFNIQNYEQQLNEDMQIVEL